MVSQRWRVLLSSVHTFSFLPSTSLFQFSVSADKLWLTFLFLGEHLEEFTGNSTQTWSSQIAWRHAGDALDDQNVKNDERLCFKLIERKMRKNAMKCKMKFSKFYLDAIICCCGGCRGNSAFRRQKKNQMDFNQTGAAVNECVDLILWEKCLCLSVICPVFSCWCSDHKVVLKVVLWPLPVWNHDCHHRCLATQTQCGGALGGQHHQTWRRR